MELSDDDTSLLEPPGKWTPPFAWTFFELLEKEGGRAGRTLIALGTMEASGDLGPKLVARVVDVGDTSSQLPHVMTGEGRVVRPGRVKITSGDVMIHRPELRGRGLGYLVLNASIEWARLHHPDAEVEPITVVRPVASSDEEWLIEFAKLTAFYGRFGFRWRSPPVETDRRNYPSEPITVAALKPVQEGDLPLIRRIDMPASLTRILHRLHEGVDDRSRVNALGEALRDRRARWRLAGYRLNWLGWAAALAIGWLAGKWQTSSIWLH